MQTWALSAKGTASARDCHVAASVTTTKSQSCMLQAEGAHRAHSSSSLTISSETGSSVQRRMVRRVRMAVGTSRGTAGAGLASSGGVRLGALLDCGHWRG